MAVSADSDPSTILRDAKGLALDLKKTLKLVAPWDRSVEFQRQRLRDHYVQLIFQNARADMAQQMLWSETSHAIINAYRSRIQQIERAIADTRTEGQSSPRGSPHGPVELRKVSQSFRTFLLQEDKFWRQFSLRLVRSYGLVTATHILARVGISEELVLDDDIDKNESSKSATMSSSAEYLAKMDMLQRSIIYLGDLSRYRDLNEALSSSKRAKGRNSSDNTDRSPKNFAVSESYYQAAISLAPQNGTPFNQLAILATYQSKQFDALYYYYRAACTKQPFATVTENMDRLLSKAIQMFRRQAEGDADLPPREEHSEPLDAFKQNAVTLHALWARNSRSTSSKLAQNIETALPTLLGERTLPADVLSRLMLMTFAALWLAEGHQPHLTLFQARPPDREVQMEPVNTASLILKHILNLLDGLFNIAQKELQQLGPHSDIQSNDALRVSAVLRRILPALRASSKWICFRFTYAEPSEAIKTNLVPNLTVFWASYVAFANALFNAFPDRALYNSRQTLEEDIATDGFLPTSSRDVLATWRSTPAQNPHPNEEHMMRIADLLLDAQTIATAEGSPLHPSELRFIGPDAHTELLSSSDLKGGVRASGNCATADTPAPGDKDDDVSTTTSDDPVNMAMRVALGSSALTDTDDDDEDVVLFPRAAAEKSMTDHSGPTAQDLLFQVLGPPEPATPTGTPKAVPAYVAVSAKNSPGLAHQPLLFGPNIWSGALPTIPSQYGAQSSPMPVYGPTRVPERNLHQRYAGAS
ncbi:hypothetical protein CALVIDRAFT_407267 [Calocera viscosa TUFC12733]|uniref:Protein SMG7 n=1 Tax=Calocera viscosa (strain TUFC12733) TaxID=1330018 RepID=A0A167PZ83_CALVF|nr:hypothetical protein CALVIDRAFT_407267 [Calocera viscosa TUFC12733]